MFDRILVPLDGSPLAEHALGPALALGRSLGRTVRLVRVISSEQAADAAENPQAEREAARYLNVVQSAYATPDRSLSTQVVSGQAAEAIVETAAQEEVDLIVMSTHGYTGFSRLMYGSVAEKVLRTAPCPVLVVRSPDAIRQVLIPLDGSQLSQQALAPGVEVAQRLGGEVTLFQAAEREPVDEGEIRQLERAEQGLGELLRGGYYGVAENYLSGLVISLRPAEVNVQTEVTSGPAAARIIQYARRHAVDLIVMATHGRTGLQRWLHGSVTEMVLRSGCCSMLILRPPQPELN